MQHEMSIGIVMPDNRSVNFTIALRATRPTCFALGMTKSGSSIFSNIVNALTLHQQQANSVDIPGSVFKAGYARDDWNTARVTDLIWPGNVYIGFRHAPTALFDDPIFKQGRKILLVRDPRDALVSEYFSTAFSHSIPDDGPGKAEMQRRREKARKINIQEYVLRRVKERDDEMNRYAPLLDDPKTMVMRYEDVILKKEAWIRAIAQHFEFDIDDEIVTGILGWADIVPQKEDQKAFVRRVVPGDHRDKLSNDTIHQLNGYLSPVWRRLGYEFNSFEGQL